MTQRVFVTGATGYLGSAIAARLVRAGHEVRGLARSHERASALVAMGIDAVLGELAEPDHYLSELKNCDAVVHVARDPGNAEEADQAAIEAIRAGAQDGRVRRFLYTSGVWVHGDTGGAVADETTPLAAAEVVKWRPIHEDAALDLAGDEVVVAVFRPGMVYGERRGTLGDWFQEARERRTVSYPGDGSQHWGMVHRDDVAEAYALALEHARGSERWLLVDESRFTVRELAEAVARATGTRAVPIDREAVLRTDGLEGAAMLMDQQFTATRARRELGWVPRHNSFVAEAEAMFREWRTAAQAEVG
jgi:nucleoside-diphosphate-sugar epimerase